LHFWSAQHARHAHAHAAGTVDELARMIERIRLSWPKTRIIVRGDGGFCREDLMAWCEAHAVDYVLGVPKNNRLKAIIAEEMAQASHSMRRPNVRHVCSRISVIKLWKAGRVSAA